VIKLSTNYEINLKISYAVSNLHKQNNQQFFKIETFAQSISQHSNFWMFVNDVYFFRTLVYTEHYENLCHISPSGQETTKFIHAGKSITFQTKPFNISYTR